MDVCPVRIDIPRMLLKLRADSVEAGKSPWWITRSVRALGWVGVRPRLFRLAGAIAARATRAMATDGWISRLPGHLSAWTKTRDFPAMAPVSFQERWAERQRMTRTKK